MCARVHVCLRVCFVRVYMCACVCVSLSLSLALSLSLSLSLFHTHSLSICVCVCVYVCMCVSARERDEYDLHLTRQLSLPYSTYKRRKGVFRKKFTPKSSLMCVLVEFLKN